MKKIKTNFKDLYIIQGKSFYDDRGFFRELYKQKLISKRIVFTVVSKSKKGVLRGLHYQARNKQGKYLSVLKGKIFDVAVDIRKNSKTYMKYFKCILSDRNNKSIYIPPGFAHGFLVTSDTAECLYKTTDFWYPENERTLLWSDPVVGIDWPLKGKFNISPKDAAGKLLADIDAFK